MNNSLDCFSDYDEEEKNSRRMTRVLNSHETQEFSDKIITSNSESDSEETDEASLTPKNENTGIIDRVKGMAGDELRELLLTLTLSEDEEDPKEKIDNEEESDIEKNQQKTKQKAQVKTVSKEDRKNKEEIEATTTRKDNKKHKQEIENISENTINKTKKGVKGKKNNSKSTNIDAQSEDNLNKIKNEDKNKYVESIHRNNRQDEKAKPNEITDFQEKNPTKSKNEKNGLHNTNKEKHTKSSMKVGNETNLKESESNVLEHVDSHVEGRVTRSTRLKQEQPKTILKEINEPLKDMVSETIKGQNKKNVKKLESEIKKPEEKSDEEGAVGKKKTGKKVATETKKYEETEIANEKEKPVKPKKTGKKAANEMLQKSQENPLSSVKEDAHIQTQKNHRTNNSKTVETLVQKELDSTVKNTKSKKKTTNSKASEVVEEPRSDKISIEKTKLKSKSDPEKNKKQLANKENKIIEDPAPNKRAARKK